MNVPLPRVFTLSAEAAGRLPYDNRVLAEVNDHVVRISTMTGPYPWHRHPNSDETFVVIEGRLVIELEGGELRLAAGQMATVARGVLHRTRPQGRRSVNLTVEARNTATVYPPAAPARRRIGAVRPSR